MSDDVSFREFVVAYKEQANTWKSDKKISSESLETIFTHFENLKKEDRKIALRMGLVDIKRCYYSSSNDERISDLEYYQKKKLTNLKFFIAKLLAGFFLGPMVLIFVFILFFNFSEDLALFSKLTMEFLKSLKFGV